MRIKKQHSIYKLNYSNYISTFLVLHIQLLHIFSTTLITKVNQIINKLYINYSFSISSRPSKIEHKQLIK